MGSSRDFRGTSHLAPGEKMSSEALRERGSPGYGVMWRGDTGTVGALRRGGRGGLSHSLAVVLWRGHLVVAGTEEGGVLHQVPADGGEIVPKPGY